MYLQPLGALDSPEKAPLQDQRSLTKDFVFMVENGESRFCAETCAYVLHRANILLEHEVYRWKFLDLSDYQNRDTGICKQDQTLVLLGGTDTPWRSCAQDISTLRTAIRNAARVCVVGSAVFVPLQTGVLGGKRIAVHPAFRAAVAEYGTHVDIEPNCTCHHKSLSSATGPVAAVRMIIDLVGAREGAFMHAALYNDLGFNESVHASGVNERGRLERKAQGLDVINEALSIMSDHLEDTLSVAQIADLVGVSPRKLERCFAERLNRSPLKVYRDLRLDRARDLIAQTGMPFKDVAVASGFSSVTLMKRWFFHKYREAPSDVRHRAFVGVAGTE